MEMILVDTLYGCPGLNLDTRQSIHQNYFLDHPVSTTSPGWTTLYFVGLSEPPCHPFNFLGTLEHRINPYIHIYFFSLHPVYAYLECILSIMISCFPLSSKTKYCWPRLNVDSTHRSLLWKDIFIYFLQRCHRCCSTFSFTARPLLVVHHKRTFRRHNPNI